MTRQQKLDKIRLKVREWINTCEPNIHDHALEKDAIEWKPMKDQDGFKPDTAQYNEGDLWRWNHSRCELH